MRKHIVLTSVGSLGDLHPIIAVALALKARGFTAVIAASEQYQRKVEAEGLAFHPVAPGPGQLRNDSSLGEGDIIRGLTRSGIRFIIDKAITPYLERSYEDLCDAMRGAGLVVAGNSSIVARITAEKLGLPVVSLVNCPCVFFSAEEPPHLLEAPWLPRFRRIFGARATKLVFDLRRIKSRWQTRRITDFRRRLGLAVPKGDELLDGPLRADRIYGLYSPVLGRLPPDAPSHSTLAGFTFYDSHEGQRFALPSDLEAFLAAGPAPLVFTLGSTGVYAPRDFYENAATTARRLKMRSVLLVGPNAEARLAGLSSHDVFVAPYAPHSLIFPRAAANIHHGGPGTIAQALRAGRVQLVCPMFGDQADNAECVVRLGVAKRLDHKRFTVDRAAAALGELLSDKVAVSSAAALAVEVASEDGAGVAADGIAALLAQIEKAHELSSA